MKNILTIDVEEIFHAEYVRRSGEKPSIFRTPINLPLILNLLDRYETRATFFLIGEIAENFEWVLSEIAHRGHEIAFHSYDHQPLWRKTPNQLEKEIVSFNKLLVSSIGEHCKGFRAPSFSLMNRTSWALEVLERTGFLYDSSIFPAWTPLYGIPNAPLAPYKPSKTDLSKRDDRGSVWEFPLAAYPLHWVRIPAAGGFYMRFAPCLVRRAISKLNRRGSPAVIYFHSWELDPEVPRPKLSPYKSFVTYHNIGGTTKLLGNLLEDFSFTSLAGYLTSTGMT
jgi:polysaccharide deacetylase family protein (PEP-CTERM system associated)